MKTLLTTLVMDYVSDDPDKEEKGRNQKDKGEDGVFFSTFGFDFNSVQSFLST